MSFKLKEIREKIDRTDFQLLSLLKQRLELTLMTKKFKKDVGDEKREKEILDRLKKKAEAFGLIESDFVEYIFSLNISESKKLQHEDYSLIGFQGEYGAYSEIAASRFNPSMVSVSCKDFPEIFDNVDSGTLDFGIVPVENTLGGAISDVNELLIDTKLNVVGEVKLPIHHCLLVLPESDHKDIKTVYSHPQALNQCRNFLNRNHLEGRYFYDTAGAAKMLSVSRPKSSAAIASQRCAKLYDLDIVKEGIEDHSENYTRFQIISKSESSDKDNNKCSIIFSVENKSGALFETLKIFAVGNINLTRIESLPRRDLPGNYYFFLDFEGDNKDEKVATILQHVEDITTKYNFLGCYKGV